jgi:hypothetical protein
VPQSEQSLVVDRPSARDSRSRTILIVDDSDTVRGSVRAVLERQTGWQVCGEATDGVDAIEKARKGGTMKLQRVVFVLIGMMFLFAVTASAQEVKTDYDRGANFAQYKTYSWKHVKTKDPLDVDRIKNAVNAALVAKGWTRVDSGGDVSIVAMEITQNQQTLNTFYDGFGGGWGFRGFGGGGFGEATTTTDTYKVGTVVVDLFDTKTKQLIWRGSSSDTLSNNSNKNIKNLDKGVDKMFKQFPPGSSKK